MPPASAPERAPRRVALYGGSFNPPHHGHVLIATWALASGRFDEVRLVPAFGHAFGKALAPFEARCRMVAAACAHLGERVVVDPIEGRLPAPSYTVDTVRALLAEAATAADDLALTLVMGTDSWIAREKWREWPALLALLAGRVLVVGREGYPAPTDVDVPFTLPDVSSTAARARLAAGAADTTLVPPAVLAIALGEGLYP
ncbi:MAG: nicotinate-nicotinamide nucleotide adenylyltransferase [Myxococcales bacterium]|nr:nicotinate-nicotinamide nucleotide adenylyltransferase [Myxococcales bacterium]MCB9736318.1 nicotinate-nicotinamide nucleotide adenylyltransferase [Deltaproteobacteria bacterium]